MKRDIERYRYINSIEYQMIHHDQFDYSILEDIGIKRMKQADSTVNNCFIMLDTETSKPHDYAEDYHHNHICAWTISIRSEHHNIVTLYGHRPDTCVNALHQIHYAMTGDITLCYVHNLTYDWQFLRKFFFVELGYPESQLNVKSHYPVSINFENGITLRDSLILSQCGLEKWADDLNVEHKKAVGKWDYNVIRDQDHVFTKDELTYIENDTLAGVECLNVLCDNLGLRVGDLPYTATGIVRRRMINIGRKHHAHNDFVKMCPPYEVYLIQNACFHGGYSHGNRYLIEQKLSDIWCFDFISSYLFAMIAFKFPMEKYMPVPYDITSEDILNTMEDYAYMFKLSMYKVDLKNKFEPMPVLQYSKAVAISKDVQDNGRILKCEYIEIYVTELDLDIILSQYDYESIRISECYTAYKDYLPRWFTDFIFDCFKEKCLLKGVDAVAYAMSKGRANSNYGMTVQNPIQTMFAELYDLNIYEPEKADPEDLYFKYIKNKNHMLPYQWGVHTTCIALHNLFKLGRMCRVWCYSDTDSVYMIDPDFDAIDKYNEDCLNRLRSNGYDIVEANGKKFLLGAAEHEGLKDEYSEFKILGAKRYCGRDKASGKLKITVAGVPKKDGVKCLHDNIDEFRDNKNFEGTITGKKTHEYIYVEDIFKDKYGNLIGDSIDLTPCDYLLQSIPRVNWDNIDKVILDIGNVYG